MKSLEDRQNMSDIAAIKHINGATFHDPCWGEKAFISSHVCQSKMRKELVSI